MNLDYNPTQPTQAQKDIYGICNATRRVRTPWLQRAAAWICSARHQGVEGAYRDHAQSNDLQEELARAILVQDISVGLPLLSFQQFCQLISQGSALPVQEKLAQNLVLLFLNLEKDHNSYEYLERTHYDLLEDLRRSLSIPVPAKRTKRDEAQLTSLVRALLELSGGRVDDQQQDFAEEYTASENTDLCASVLNITRTRHFGDFDSEEMCKMLSKSAVFSGMTVGVRDLEKWTFEMTEYLHVEFPKDLREDGECTSSLFCIVLYHYVDLHRRSMEQSQGESPFVLPLLSTPQWPSHWIHLTQRKDCHH